MNLGEKIKECRKQAGFSQDVYKRQQMNRQIQRWRLQEWSGKNWKNG